MEVTIFGNEKFGKGTETFMEMSGSSPKNSRLYNKEQLEGVKHIYNINPEPPNLNFQAMEGAMRIVEKRELLEATKEGRPIGPISPGRSAHPPLVAAGDSLRVDVKRCVLVPKTPPRGPRNARMSTGGKVPFKKLVDRKVIVISSGDEAPRKMKEGIVIVPTRRSKRLLGLKRKNYEEKTPEPADYVGDSDWEDDRSPGSWGAAGRDDDGYDNWGWHEEDDRKEQDGRRQDEGREIDEDDDEQRFEEHNNCCHACRQNIRFLLDAVDDIIQTLQEVGQKIDDSDHRHDDDFKFLQRNIRKLFGMYGSTRKNRQSGEGSSQREVCKQCGQRH